MAVVEVLCLANSRKLGGRCVAGLRTDGGGWVRPVAGSPDGTLFPEHYRLHDGSEARVLDVLRIDLASPCPKPHQPENWLLGRTPWTLVSRPGMAPRPPSLLDRLLDLFRARTPPPAPQVDVLALLRAHRVTGPALLGNTADRVAFAALARGPARASLALVAPDDLRWVLAPGYAGKPQARASFRLAGQRYNLPVTDPLWERRLRALPTGTHPPEAAGIEPGQAVWLTISLGEPFEQDQCCYKLVAAVIPLPRPPDGAP